MSLRDAQALFFDVLRGDADPTDARVPQTFVSDSRLDAAARLEIYKDMYEGRIIEVLQGEFPMLFALLGECPFADLSREYLREYPSDHPDVGQVGRALAAFIRGHEGVRGDLCELAELERARSLAFSTEDVIPRAWEELAAAGPETFASTRLRFVPALRVLDVTHDVAELWTSLKDGEQPAPVQLEGPTTLAIWKKGFEVLHAPLDAPEARALAAARGGATLGEVCEHFAAAEDPASAAFTAISSWFNEGWVAQVLPPDA